MFVDNLFALGTTGFLMVAFIGLCVGSFLNVVVYRLPIMLNRDWTQFATEHLAEQSGQPETDLHNKTQTDEPFNLAVPRSRCPNCNELISAWQNIPLVSWILLRGRCKNCANPISVRYPLVELLTGAMSLGVIGTFGFTTLGLAALLFTWILIAVTFIDFDTQLLPDQLTLPLVWLGLLINLKGNGIVSLEDAVIGAVAGYLFLWSTFWAFKLIRGKEGMGYGDFKLYAAIGALMGWQVLPAVILIASVVGLIFALVSIALSRSTSAQPFAFGPYLAIAGWVCLIFRDTVLAVFGGAA